MYYSSVKAKGIWPSATAHKLSKVPPELIEHLKNSADIPKKSKENHNPREHANVHPDIKIEHKNTTSLKTDEADKVPKTSKTKIVEGDISRIACSYVLEGNFLKKKQVYQEAIKKQKKKASGKDKENGQQTKEIDRKELLKLEYLEKMGFLRPDEETSLAQYRKVHPQQCSNEPPAKKTPTINQSMRTEYPPESLNNLSYYSPKNVDPRMLSNFYGSNSKLMHSHKAYY